MTYPSRLLPKPTYRLIDNSALPDDVVLLRRIPVNQGRIPFDEFGELPASVILGAESRSRLNGLSLNLLGVFTPSDIVFHATPSRKCPEPHAYWQPGDQVPPSTHIGFNVLNDVAPLYIPYTWWHERSFPVREEVDFPSNQSFGGRTRVAHCPTVTNFWHFELHFMFSDGTTIQNSKAKWKKKAYQFVLRTAITVGKEAISTSPLPYTTIEESVFSV